jgi:carbonic anhydrase
MMMKKISPSLLVLALLAALAAPTWGAGGGAAMSAEEALARLKAGNERFLTDKPQYPHQGRERRALTFGQGQHPFAAVLACSDSRGPVELIFDQGIGDLFVVRVAGNVAQSDELGSLEYAAEHFEPPLLVVLGHTHCGAVGAVLENAKLSPHIASLVAPIKGAVARAKADNPEADPEALLTAAVKANVFQAMEDLLKKSAVLKAQVKAKKLRLIGALYEIDTGRVQWLGPHPDQDKWLGLKGKGQAAGQPDREKKGGEGD